MTDDTDMADLLNSYFCSVFTNEDLSNMNEPEQLYTGDRPVEEVNFTGDKAKKKLSALKPSAAPDGVWTRILHQLAEPLSGPLAIIFSKLFQEGQVPEIWRRANVCITE